MTKFVELFNSHTGESVTAKIEFTQDTNREILISHDGGKFVETGQNDREELYRNYPENEYGLVEVKIPAKVLEITFLKSEYEKEAMVLTGSMLAKLNLAIDYQYFEPELLSEII